MKKLFIPLFALPFVLFGCQSEQADAVEDQGEAIEEVYEDSADVIDEMIEEGAPAGDSADVIGDGEIFDEAGEPDADSLGA